MSSPASRRARPRPTEPRSHLSGGDSAADTVTQLTLLDLAPAPKRRTVVAVAPPAPDRPPTPAPSTPALAVPVVSADACERADAPPAAGPALLLTVPEAARLLGVGRTSIYKLLTTGELASVHIGASRRIPLDAVHSLIHALRSTPT